VVANPNCFYWYSWLAVLSWLRQPRRWPITLVEQMASRFPILWTWRRVLSAGNIQRLSHDIRRVIRLVCRSSSSILRGYDARFSRKLMSHEKY